MPYRTMGWIHAHLARLGREQRGQGTVEYVGLMLLLAALLTGVVFAAKEMADGGGLAKEIAAKLKQTIDEVGIRSRSGGPTPPVRGAPLRTWRPCPPPPQRTAPIGVFDSGVGGLTVLHELLVALPQEDFLYLGDSARFPYGDRTPRELRAFSRQIADVLLARGAKLLVVACNSATSSALADLTAHVAARGHGVDVIGVVGPESNLAVARTRNGRIGVLATPATVASGAYERAILAADPLVKLTSVPCAQLARDLQDGAPITEDDVVLARAYCAPLREAASTRRSSAARTTRSSARCCSACSAREVTLITTGTAIARRVQHALSTRELGHAARRRGQLRLPVHR